MKAVFVFILSLILVSCHNADEIKKITKQSNVKLPDNFVLEKTYKHKNIFGMQTGFSFAPGVYKPYFYDEDGFYYALANKRVFRGIYISKDKSEITGWMVFQETKRPEFEGAIEMAEVGFSLSTPGYPMPISNPITRGIAKQFLPNPGQIMKDALINESRFLESIKFQN